MKLRILERVIGVPILTGDEKWRNEIYQAPSLRTRNYPLKIIPLLYIQPATVSKNESGRFVKKAIGLVLQPSTGKRHENLITTHRRERKLFNVVLAHKHGKFSGRRRLSQIWRKISWAQYLYFKVNHFSRAWLPPRQKSKLEAIKNNPSNWSLGKKRAGRLW